MSDIKIQPSATGSATVTLTAPATGTARTVTLPDSTDTLAVNSDVTNKLPLAGGTMTGTIAGFTSTGIDDNATSTAVTIDAAENVGIGVTPETWKSNWTALQFGGLSSLSAHTAATAGREVYLSSNKYRATDDNDKYIISGDEASEIGQFNGKLLFKVAPSGTADSAISWTTAMQIDNNGIVTKPNQPVFDVHFSSSGTVSQGTIVHNVTVVDIGGNHSTSNGRFTAPVAGTYYFYTTFIKANTTSTGRRYIQKNGANVSNGRHLRLDSGSSYGDNGTLAITITLSAGDYVTAYQSDTDSYGEGYDYFGGHLIG